MRHDPEGLPWDTTTELLAQVVEELSRLTRESPLEVERPWEKGTKKDAPVTDRGGSTPATPPPSPAPPQQGIHQSPDGGVVANGMFAMIQLAAGQGHTVRSTAGE